ncbi:hypothetical protein [Methanosalsum natronophilum]|uniref:hypothetical protein n=1 Tax=Methanosalsum natronophilum TaxID=768733 RepID=UPI00216A8445|nr:hypothetical protein [Methanosalsum natronophilum]MCS3924212.1 hypothetical protein [Methanosalsum natronophilum]
MKLKILMILSFSVLMLTLSIGCIDNNEELPDMDVEDLSMVEDTPHELEHLGNPTISGDSIANDYVDVPGIVEASRGIYQSDDAEIHLTVIEMEDTQSADNFVEEYKATYPEFNNRDRFVEETVDGQDVTRINKFTRVGGEYVDRFTYIWNQQNYVFVVEGNTDDYTFLKDFVKAAGF